MLEVAAAGGATDQVVSHQSCNEGNEATGRSSTGRARSAVGEDFGRHRWLRIRYVSGRRREVVRATAPISAAAVSLRNMRVTPREQRCRAAFRTTLKSARAGGVQRAA